MAASARNCRIGKSRTATKPSGSIAAMSEPEDFTRRTSTLVAEAIARGRLQRGVAAAVQDKLSIAAKEPRRIDAKRQVAVDAGLGALRHHGLGIAIDPAAFHAYPPAKRRDHHPVLRGRSLAATSPVSMTTGSGTGAADGAGVGGAAASVTPTGAGSRTVERRRTGSDSAACGGAASRSATASLSSGSVAGVATNSVGSAKVPGSSGAAMSGAAYSSWPRCSCGPRSEPPSGAVSPLR